MRETRQSALRAIREVGLCCTLAVVVTKGVSECEIGDIVSFAVDNIDVVRAINFQSATRLTGRFGIGENYQGYGLQELISLIEAGEIPFFLQFKSGKERTGFGVAEAAWSFRRVRF